MGGEEKRDNCIYSSRVSSPTKQEVVGLSLFYLDPSLFYQLRRGKTNRVPRQ